MLNPTCRWKFLKKVASLGQVGHFEMTNFLHVLHFDLLLLEYWPDPCKI